MENIEQLKLENDKLKERLNNAAKFFREQKAQIEALTKENEELKRIPQESNSKEIENLKEQLAASNEACADMEKTIHKNLEDIEKLQIELKKSQEYANATYEEIKNKYDDLHNVYDKLNKESENAISEKNKLEKEHTKLCKEYDELKQTHNITKIELTNKIELLSKHNSELENLNTNQADRISKLDESYNAKNAEISKLKSICDEVEISNNKLTKENELLNKNIKSKEEEISKLSNEVNIYKDFATKIEQIKNILEIKKQVSDSVKVIEQKRMGSNLESKIDVFSL